MTFGRAQTSGQAGNRFVHGGGGLKPSRLGRLAPPSFRGRANRPEPATRMIMRTEPRRIRAFLIEIRGGVSTMSLNAGWRTIEQPVRGSRRH